MMRARLVAALVSSAVIAAACGSDTETVGSTTSTEPTTTTAAPEPVRFEPSAGVQRAEVVAVDTSTLVSSFNDVGFDLLRSPPSGDNLVLSPTSIGHAVLMAREAADGQTVEAIDESLGLPAGIAAHDAWNAIDQAIAGLNGLQTGLDDDPTPLVTIADRIWPSLTANPDQDWVDLLASHHGADVSPIDVQEPEESRKTINDWIGEQTNGLIPELIPVGFISPSTQLVLTDAIYFKAQWRSVFGKYGEVDAPFGLLDGSTVDVTFLRDLEQPGPRGTGNGWTAAELPYLGDGYSMLLIIPDEGNFDEVRGRLTNEFLAEIDAELASGPYELLMPEWETTSELDLLSWLTDIGAAPGSYPGIGPGVFLSGGVHGADIAVDEIGTVAAAATALGFDESGPAEPELTVAADRPFLYVLRHVESGLVLFVGQVTDPTA
jgi:serpin B